MPEPASLFEEAKRQLTSDDGDLGRKTALVTGSVALGAVITSSLFRRIRHLKLKSPKELTPAIDAETGSMEVMEGRARFYRRDGTGIPIVLLHSINAAASSYEMKPIFDHLAKSTARPIYALDWIGFGRSDRPPVRYTRFVYERQLRRFLSEHVHQPADLIALSLASEYTAEIARSLPYLVHRLILISPTGLSDKATTAAWRRALVSLSDSVGAFEIFYYRLTQPQLLRKFYDHQIFRSSTVPEELVDYARETTLVAGAHHAPRFFVQGELDGGTKAISLYRDVRVPTFILVPEDDSNLIQRFERVDELVGSNPEYIHFERLPSGLMPQWEVPYHCFDAIDRFLTE